jgi:putative ABC transport system permease protein
VSPTQDELDDEIRGHMALSVKERIECGDDPESARYAALREFGNVTLMRESMQSVWRPRWLDTVDALGQDIRVALRSLRHAKGLSITVALTLALGIGANAAIFSVVRQVLLRPLVNRDEDRLIYIRQRAPGLGAANTMFSIPEISDLRARSKAVAAFGDFSTIDFTLIGLGEPRVINGGVASGSYFEVMGLRPVLGRLLGPSDDGPNASGAAVLTYRFWSTSLNADPAVVGKTIRLGSRTATVVGVLEPSVPYPADTEIIANVVSSPHHLGAVMVAQRTHRMTELFGRLAPGATIEEARTELAAAHAAMLREHPEAFSASASTELSVTRLRDQITAPARNVLLALLAAAGIVFAIACSNVANLILARTVRRQRELSVRAALGASRGALRRTLLAESLVLCSTGAILGVLLARPLVAVVGGYAARFSVRAAGVTVDQSLLWIGVGLALVAAVVLAYVPRLPSAHPPTAPAVPDTGSRIAPGANRRLRAFAVAQVALSFLLLAGAGMILASLVALQTARTGYDMQHVLALDVPVPIESATKSIDLYQEITRRIRMLSGVEQAAIGNFVPWRDVTSLLPSFPFAVDGHTPADGEDPPRARLRTVGPGFFATMSVPIVAGRGFTDEDRLGGELVVIVSQSIAQRLFPDGSAINRRLWWTEPLFGAPQSRRIVGIATDVDDENVVPRATQIVYHPFQQMPAASRVFIRVEGDPYALVAPVTRIIRELSANQPVERAATLADVRATVLAPERLNAFVIAGFAGIALLIAVVGVAGVLAFSVSARTREFGVRLAVGSTPRHLLTRVMSEGMVIAAIGIIAGAVGGYGVGALAARYVDNLRLPGALPLLSAAIVLMIAAVVASLMPAARASRVDVLQALRTE